MKRAVLFISPILIRPSQCNVSSYFFTKVLVDEETKAYATTLKEHFIHYRVR